MKNCRYRFCHETVQDIFALFVNSVYNLLICKFTHDFFYTCMYCTHLEQIIQLCNSTHHSSLNIGIEHF